MKNITGIFLCKMILLIILPCMPVFCFSATGDSSLVVKFKNNRPAVTGSYTKGVRNGEWKYFYKNGNVRYSIIYKESLAEGPVKYYSKNKKVLFEGNFSMGMHDGEWKYYYPSGELESEKFFHCGKTLKTWKHYSEGGKIDAQYNMDSAGIGFIDYKFLATPFVEFKLADSFITNKNNCFHLEWSLYTNHEVTEEYETKGSKLNGIYFSSDIHAKCYQTGNGCGLGMLATLQEGSYKAGKKENSWVTNTIEKWKDTIHAAILLISQSKITGTYSADTLNGEFSLSEKNKVYEPEAFFNIEKKAYYSHGILDGRFSSRDSFRSENGVYKNGRRSGKWASLTFHPQHYFDDSKSVTFFDSSIVNDQEIRKYIGDSLLQQCTFKFVALESDFGIKGDKNFDSAGKLRSIAIYSDSITIELTVSDSNFSPTDNSLIAVYRNQEYRTFGSGYLSVSFEKKGMQVIRSYYKNGNPAGVYITKSFDPENKHITLFTAFYPNGKKHFEAHTVSLYPYSRDGYTFNNNQWDINGNKAAKSPSRMGGFELAQTTFMDGNCLFWNEDGTFKAKRIYRNGYLLEISDKE